MCLCNEFCFYFYANCIFLLVSNSKNIYDIFLSKYVTLNLHSDTFFLLLFHTRINNRQQSSIGLWKPRGFTIISTLRRDFFIERGKSLVLGFKINVKQITLAKEQKISWSYYLLHCVNPAMKCHQVRPLASRLIST